MNDYINIIIHNRWFIMFLFFCIVMLFFFWCFFISKYFEGIIYKLLLLTYLIYFPIGLFMSIYYRIITYDWFPSSNEFTILFLAINFCMVCIFFVTCITSKLPYNYKTWYLSSERLEGRKQFLQGFTLLFNSCYYYPWNHSF